MEGMDFTRLVERPRPTILSANVLGLLAIAGLWIGSAIALIVAPEAGFRQDLAVNAIYYLPFVLLPVVICMRRRGGLSEAVRLNPMPLFPALSVMLLAVLSVFAATGIDALWLRLLEAFGLREPDTGLVIESSSALVLSILNSAAVPAICEELLFRGYMLSAWESRGTRLAIGVSTALFALLHSNLFGMPAYLLVGAVSAFLVFALDSLYAGILYHTVYNATILVVVFLASGSEASGAMPGLSSILSELLVTLGMMAMLLLSLHLRRRASGIEPIPRSREPLRRSERVTLVALVAAMVLSMLAVLLGG